MDALVKSFARIDLKVFWLKHTEARRNHLFTRATGGQKKYYCIFQGLTEDTFTAIINKKENNNNLGCSIFHTHANLPSVCIRYFVSLELRTLVFTTNYIILALKKIFHNRLIRKKNRDWGENKIAQRTRLGGNEADVISWPAFPVFKESYVAIQMARWFRLS